MDLIGEASSGSRVLSARHVGAAARAPVPPPPPPPPPRAPAPAFLCESDLVPDAHTYLKALDTYGVILLATGALAVAALLVLYWLTVRGVRGARADVRSCSARVAAVYPVVGAAAYCALVVPRAQLLAEAVMQGALMLAMYQLFCLLVAYCGGEDELIRRVKPGLLETRVAPCCCWPCCLLPRPQLDRRALRRLRLLVLQLPLVQGAVYVALLVAWADQQSVYQVIYMYVQPAVVLSIVCGVWGVVMACRAAETCLQDAGLQLKGKFLALQLVLVAAKLQGAAARLLPAAALLPCRAPLTPRLHLNLIYNCLVLGEMVLLALWAMRLYRDAPDTAATAGDLAAAALPIHQVKVIDEAPKFLKKEGINNNSFDDDKH